MRDLRYAKSTAKSFSFQFSKWHPCWFWLTSTCRSEFEVLIICLAFALILPHNWHNWRKFLTTAVYIKGRLRFISLFYRNTILCLLFPFVDVVVLAINYPFMTINVIFSQNIRFSRSWQFSLVIMNGSRLIAGCCRFIFGSRYAESTRSKFGVSAYSRDRLIVE